MSDRLSPASVTRPDGRLRRLPALPGELRRWVADLLPRLRRSIWRVAVADDSMRPAIEPGDWLLLDPTTRVWPRHGSVVVAREPETDLLVIKRVAARPGDHVHLRQGLLHLAEDEAWLLGDAPGSIDSRRYGPVTLDRLVGRAWFRYWPIRRIGLVRRVPRYR